MIKVQNLFKRYGLLEALRDVTFSIEPGESVGLLGENGAGKSTTMRILACFIPPSSGVIEVGGHDVVFESAAVRQRIGYLPENVPLYGGMRVEEYLRYRAKLKGVPARDVKEKVSRALGLVDLGGRRRSLIQTLSKGLRQRAGLADALVHEPELLILDEPTSGLDPSQRREVRKLIRSLGEGHTVLVSSHILPEIEATCDRAVVINRGRVVAQESIAAMKNIGERDRFRIVLRNGSDELAQSLGGLEGVELLTSSRDGQLMTLDLEAIDRRSGRASAVRRMVEGGADIHEVASKDVSLEEAFLRLIGKEDEA